MKFEMSQSILQIFDASKMTLLYDYSGMLTGNDGNDEVIHSCFYLQLQLVGDDKLETWEFLYVETRYGLLLLVLSLSCESYKLHCYIQPSEIQYYTPTV